MTIECCNTYRSESLFSRIYARVHYLLPVKGYIAYRYPDTQAWNKISGCNMSYSLEHIYGANPEKQYIVDLETIIIPKPGHQLIISQEDDRERITGRIGDCGFEKVGLNVWGSGVYYYDSDGVEHFRDYTHTLSSLSSGNFTFSCTITSITPVDPNEEKQWRFRVYEAGVQVFEVFRPDPPSIQTKDCHFPEKTKASFIDIELDGINTPKLPSGKIPLPKVLKNCVEVKEVANAQGHKGIEINIQLVIPGTIDIQPQISQPIAAFYSSCTNCPTPIWWVECCPDGVCKSDEECPEGTCCECISGNVKCCFDCNGKVLKEIPL